LFADHVIGHDSLAPFTVAAIVGSDIAPTCVAVMKRKRLLVALLPWTHIVIGRFCIN
jgi:hypothetical protein